MINIKTTKLPEELSNDFYRTIGELVSDNCIERIYNNEVTPKHVPLN